MIKVMAFSERKKQKNEKKKLQKSRGSLKFQDSFFDETKKEQKMQNVGIVFARYKHRKSEMQKKQSRRFENEVPKNERSRE